MRLAFLGLLAVLALSPGLLAREKSAWANVEKLRPGTPIFVVLQNGQELRGELEAVDANGLRLTTLDRRGALIASNYRVDRTSIRKIVRFRRPKLPNPGKWMLIGTLAGGAFGATAGAIHNASHKGDAVPWPITGLAGAGVGFFGSCVVLAGVGATDSAILIFRHSATVYEAKSTGSQPTPTPSEFAAALP